MTALDARLATAPHRTPYDSPLTIVTELALTGGQDARVSWSRHWFGASLLTRAGLTERERLAAVRWAVGVLEQHLTDDGYADSGAADLRLAAQLAG
jgi:hypothetical protein